MSIHAFKTRIDKVLTEAIDMNKDQISNGAAENFATYKYLVGVAQTLADMQGRIHDEYVKQLKSTGETHEDN
jgi:hypothetical protein